MKVGRASILVFGVLLAGADAGQKSAAKTDREKLQGEWIMISGEMGGKKIEKEVIDDQTYEFKGDVLIIKYQGLALGASKYTLTPSKKPKELNILINEDTNPAIYELDGDRLKICMDKPKGVRPKAFRTRAGSAQKLFLFKRKK
jgi:uncharacterized protein (TIGR03067 family)